MRRKTKHALGLTAAARELSGGALKTNETLPRAFAQQAEDLDRRSFHADNGQEESKRVKSAKVKSSGMDDYFLPQQQA